MNIKEALEVLKTKEDYIVPNCTFDVALDVAIKFIEKTIDNN